MMDFFRSLLNMIMGGQNPVQLLMNILSNNLQSGTPVYNNLATMTQNQDARGLEAFARNLAASKGLDFDRAFADFKRNNLGM